MDGAMKAAADAWAAAEGFKQEADRRLLLAISKDPKMEEHSLTNAVISIAASLRELACLWRAK